MLTCPFNLQWKTIKKIVLSPSWIPLWNQRMMVSSPLLYTGNPHMGTNTYIGTVTIISRPKIVTSVPSPIGPKQSVAILSSCKKLCSISGKLLLIVTTPSGLWTRWRKDLLGLPVRSLMGLTAQTLQMPSPLPSKLKPRVR